MLKVHGSIQKVACASASELALGLDGDVEWVDALIAGRSLYSLAMAEQVERSRVDPRCMRFRSYLVSRLRPQRQEVILCIAADAQGGFISDDVIGQGDGVSVQLQFRHLFARLLSLDARQFVLAHNHPDASAEPSVEDIEATSKIANHSRSLGIELMDHIIVGSTGVTSMVERGLL